MYAQNRTKLMDAIPLKLPLCISIEPSNLCNFKCAMCYHGNNEYAEEAKPLKNMDMDCFQKCVDDITSWTRDVGERVKLIKLYSLGEPLLHPQLCEMVRIIKQSDICGQIEITTNASLLTREIAEKLVDYGLDILKISVYGARPESCQAVTGRNVHPEEIREKVQYLKDYRDAQGKNLPVIYAKMINTYTEENELFTEQYKDAADHCVIDDPFHIPVEGTDVYKNLYGAGGEEIFNSCVKTEEYAHRRVCRYAFTHLTVRNDGSAVVCCTDWLKELRLGNVMEHTLKEIWESKTLYDIRCGMLTQKGEQYRVCKNCELPYRDLPEDNVEGFPIEKLSYQNEF
jgi:radical SAM protein with 4Fe4S-binding SPASM domain